MLWWKWGYTQLLLHGGCLKVFWYTWGQNTCVPKLLLRKWLSYSWWQERRCKQIFFFDITVLGLCHVTTHRWRYRGAILQSENYDIWKLCWKVPTGYVFYMYYIFSDPCLAVHFSAKAINLTKLNATVKGEIRKNIDLLGSLMTQTTNLGCILAAEEH